MRSLRSDRLWAALPLAALLGAGCGIGVTENLVPLKDGGSGDSMNGPSDAQVCMPYQAFGTPTQVPGFDGNITSVVSVRFTPNELTAYLGILHGPQVDIYVVASRARRTDPLGPAMRVNELNTNFDDEYPTVTADSFTIYFDSTRSGTSDLYRSTRTSTVYQFSAPVELTDLHVDGEGAPYVLPDGSALYFHTHRNGNFDVYRAQKNATGFDPAESLTINTDADEMAPVVSANELTIYFFRRGDPNGGADGIWMATRSTVTNPFGIPVPLADLSAPYPGATPIWISPDGCRLYLQEKDPQLGYWAYVAERMP
jgi:hypothetical protein